MNTQAQVVPMANPYGPEGEGDGFSGHTLKETRKVLGAEEGFRALFESSASRSL